MDLRQNCPKRTTRTKRKILLNKLNNIMIELVEAKPPYHPDCGDILWEGRTLLEPIVRNSDGHQIKPLKLCERDKWQPIPLIIVNTNPICALTSLSIDVNILKKTCTYVCPYNQYSHLGIVPVAVLSKDANRYRAPFPNIQSDYVFDWEWHMNMLKDDIFKLCDVYYIKLGSGYTEGTSSFDGSGTRRQTTIALDNGDKLWVYFWEWYNK
jgi:hypothetical protein